MDWWAHNANGNKTQECRENLKGISLVVALSAILPRPACTAGSPYRQPPIASAFKVVDQQSSYRPQLQPTH